MDDLDFGTYEAAPVVTAGPTDSQMKFIAGLREAWQEAETELARLQGRDIKRPKWADPETKAQASKMIDAGKAARIRIRSELTIARQAARPIEPAEDAPSEEGMWIIGNVGEDGCRIFMVKLAVHGSGKPYALELTEDGFEYISGGMHTVRSSARRMSLEEGQKYGKIYGVCVRCHTTLTDPKSIERGIGPVCASKMG